jgi:hypothetical protein
MNTKFNVMVSTVPKCGTYLGAALLRSIGFIDQELHVYNSAAENYRGLEEDEKIKEPVNTFDFNLVHHLRWSRPRTFVVGHPSLTQDLLNYLQTEDTTKVLYITRDLRLAAISQMRFLARAEDIHAYVKEEPFWTMSLGPEKILSFLCSRAFHEWLKYAHTQKYWLGAESLDNLYIAKFQDLRTGSNLGLLSDFLECKIEPNYHGLPTRTYSSIKSEEIFDKFWTDEHQRMWENTGASSLNRLYESPLEIKCRVA